MSIKVMSEVWGNGPEDRNELLVLLALADFADDAGVCWPAMASIAAKARMTERGVQKVVGRLVETGRLTVETGGGRHGCNNYRIIKNPERETVNTVHPERHSPNTVTETPNTGSPEPSKNHHSFFRNALRFEDFWEEWPYRIAKASAEKAWRKLSQPDREAALANARPWADRWRRNNPTASAIHPATYLNQARWKDELPEDQRPQQVSRTPTRTPIDRYAFKDL